jgi:hypothetical protein
MRILPKEYGLPSLIGGGKESKENLLYFDFKRSRWAKRTLLQASIQISLGLA